MEIDLSPLLSNTVDHISLDGSYELSDVYYKNTDIVDLLPIKVKGYVFLNEEEIECIKCSIDGEMIINDSISLERVNYPFHIDYDDIIEKNCKKCENILDILVFLWENIVLEVPLQFTKVRDLSKFHGDGWKLISEDELIHENNPFSDLLKDIEEE